MITDINEVWPLTIVAKSSWKAGKWNNYIALNMHPEQVPPQTEMVRFLDEDTFEYMTKFDYWLETTDIVYGRGESIKDACKDLVKQLNRRDE